MALVNRPDFSIKWAEAGNVLEPATEKRELGHVVEKPPYEIVNWIENNQDNGIAYLMQEGISDWSLDQDYSATSYVKYDGVVYRAKVASIGKQPDIEAAVWEIAFVDYTDYTDLTQDLYDTKNTAGHAANLVYKNAPIMTARADGTSYKADVGTSLTPTDNVGYVFDGKETDGIFHDGERVVVQKNGTIVAEFDQILSSNESSKKVVTMDVLLQYIQIYKVGDLYLTTDPTEPSQRLGYGVWQRYALGKALVGANPTYDASVPEWVKVGGTEFGEYNHTLTQNEIPSHKHTTQLGDAITSGESTTISSGGGLIGIYDTQSMQVSGGGDQPHNNVQPSVVIYIWKRIS